MNKHCLLPLFCLVAALLTGCGMRESPPTLPSESSMEVRPGVSITTQEIELLSNIYPNEADRIAEGKLFGHQDEALNQLRAATEYLEEKYPGETFESVYFEPATKLNSVGNLTVENGESYTVYIEHMVGGYSCSDTCYTKFLRPKYDEYLEQVLVDGGYTARTYTYFPAASTGLGPDTTLEELLLTAPRLARVSHLYVTAENKDVAVAGIQELIAQEGVYGSYNVYFVNELEDLQTMEAQHTGQEYTSFNIFEI